MSALTKVIRVAVGLMMCNCGLRQTNVYGGGSLNTHVNATNESDDTLRNCELRTEGQTKYSVDQTAGGSAYRYDDTDQELRAGKTNVSTSCPQCLESQPTSALSYPLVAGAIRGDKSPRQSVQINQHGQ